MADDCGASSTVLVLGGGNFGTCLANHLADKGHSVTLYSRSAEVAESINTSHVNPKYLSQFSLSEQLSATSELKPEHFANASVVLLVIPTQSLRSALEPLKEFISPDHLLVCAAKGIENGTGRMPHGIITDVMGEDIGHGAVFLSGPSFAAEVVVHQPTMVTVASHDEERAKRAQEVFHAPHFRAYRSDDPTGVEVAGALKNVMAIASGAASGLGFQMNARAGFVTRGLAEITRVGVALGASPQTFAGLSGVGDLFLTCSSEKSRNFRVGKRLGQGETLPYILETLGSVAEGVATTKAAYALASTLPHVDTPIIDQVYAVLYQGVPLEKALYILMNRDMAEEHSLPTPRAATDAAAAGGHPLPVPGDDDTAIPPPAPAPPTPAASTTAALTQ